MLGACEIDQDAAHHLCCHSKEVRPVLPADCFPIDKPEVSLIYKSGRLQKMARTFVSHEASGKYSASRRGEVESPSVELVPDGAVVPRPSVIAITKTVPGSKKIGT